MMMAVFIVVVAVPCLHMAMNLWNKAFDLRNTSETTKMLEIYIGGMSLHQEFEHQRAVDADRLEWQAGEWLVGGALLIVCTLTYPVLALRHIKKAGGHVDEDAERSESRNVS